MKKILRQFKILKVDILIYSLKKEDYEAFSIPNYTIEENNVNLKKRLFFIKNNDQIIHKSFLFSSLHLLHVLKKKGPAIGDCVTNSNFKGQSIYPYVINFIAHKLLFDEGKQEVFIVVNSNNTSSIKGIEKAHFKLRTSLKATKFLGIYFNKEN